MPPAPTTGTASPASNGRSPPCATAWASKKPSVSRGRPSKRMSEDERKKIALIRRILDDDKEVASTEPWMDNVRQLLSGGCANAGARRVRRAADRRLTPGRAASGAAR